MADAPVDADRLIQSVLAELGWEADPVALADRVRRLDIGLPAEDEFAVVCGWLGKARLLHKLDQQQVPVRSQDEFQVPDMLALFGEEAFARPVLIEIKSKKDRKLSFRADYYGRLRRYADLLELPLLIAWKFHSIWMLFEASHMKKARTNFNIRFEDAIRENLLGILAGDVAYNIGSGAGLHFRMKKVERLSQTRNGDEVSEQWQMVIDDVAFTDRSGARRTDLTPDVQSLFTAWDLDEHDTFTDTHITRSFVAADEGIQFAHSALVRLLDWYNRPEESTNWRKLLREPQVTRDIRNFEATLNNALRQNIVQYVFQMQPQSMPAFIRKSG